MLSNKEIKYRLASNLPVSLVYVFRNDFPGGSGKTQGQIKSAKFSRKKDNYAFWTVTFIDGRVEKFDPWGSEFVSRILPFEKVTW